jgi:3-hydroxybutyryl-CoA dehydratase
MAFVVGDVVSDSVEITEQIVNDFAEVSGDKNPIHLDEVYAKTTRFGRRVAHGMFSAALISRVLGMKLGSGGIYLGQTLKFTAPLFIGDTATVTCTVRQLRDKGIGRITTIVTKQDGTVCVEGEATIMDGDFV